MSEDTVRSAQAYLLFYQRKSVASVAASSGARSPSAARPSRNGTRRSKRLSGGGALHHLAEMGPFMSALAEAEQVDSVRYINWLWWLKRTVLGAPRAGPLDNSPLCCPHGHWEGSPGKMVRAQAVPLTMYRALLASTAEALGSAAVGGPELAVPRPCLQCAAILREQGREIDDVAACDRTQLRGPDERWMLIDSRWLAKWRQWTEGGVEAPRPGPVDNTRLFLETSPGSGVPSLQPRPGLLVSHDYRGLVPDLWHLFVKRHGLIGPTIMRSTINLYEQEALRNEPDGPDDDENDFYDGNEEDEFVDSLADPVSN